MQQLHTASGTWCMVAWVKHPGSARTVLDEGLKQRLIRMRLRRENREQAGIQSCPNLYRLDSRRRRQRNVEQKSLSHWFASRKHHYVPRLRHMLSPVRTAEDELTQVHLSSCLIRNPVAVGLEKQFRHGSMVVAG